MGFVPPEFLDELRMRLNISDIVRAKIKLDKHGNTFKACCPFHNEKTPSFVVDDKRGNYHCFGCGEHGDIFSFTMKHDGVDFPTAIERLAQQAGVVMPKSEPANPEMYKKRTGLYELMEQACQYYQRALNTPAGKSAREYVVNRGITPKALADFRLGYTPHGNDMIGFLEKKDFTKAQMMDAGLVREKDGRHYCFFRNRLVFPVIDKRNRVVAFSCRILDGDGPKYINSQETPIYNKGSMLYGAHLIKREKDIYVAEGNVDVIAMHIAGFTGTVAPLGTAMTENQISELWKLTNTPVLCFDGDSAGYKAAERAINRALPMLKPDYSMSVVFMPKGEDPDTLIKKKGVAEMKKYLDGAKGLFDCLWDFEKEHSNMDTPEGKAGFEKSIKSKVFEIQDEAVKGYYLNAIKDKLFEKRSFKPFKKFEKSGKFGKQPEGPKPKGVKYNRDMNLKAIMASLLNYPEVFSKIENDLLNVEVLSKSKLYEATYMILEEGGLTSEELIEGLKSEGHSDAISKVLNIELYTHFQWCRPDQDKVVVEEKVSSIISEILKQQSDVQNKQSLRNSDLSEEDLQKLLEKKKEKLRRK